MKGIKFLGAQGSVGVDSSTTCIQITKHTLIDAGNIISSLGEEAKYIDNIFLTHSHLDHIIDCSFLLDNLYTKRKKPLKLYGLSETIEALKAHIFNNTIWPDFSKFNIKNSSLPSLEFVKIKLNEKYKIEDGVYLTPIEATHTIPCCGYIIEKGENAILFSADTYKNKKLWKKINTNDKIKTLVIDVSFSNTDAHIASESKHLCPRFLKEELLNLKRDNLNIYINHIKPPSKDDVTRELAEIGIFENNILNDGDIILYKNGKKIDSHSNLEKKIVKLNNIGAALSQQENIDSFLQTIVTEAKNLTQADGGTIYLVKDRKLKFKIIQTDSLGIDKIITDLDDTWPDIPMYQEKDMPNKKMVATLCALTGKTINISDVYDTNLFSFEGTKKFDKSNNYRSKSMLVIPLKNHESKIIGVLQLINKMDFLHNKAINFNKKDEDTALSLASQAAITITNTQLIKGLEDLLEAFLRSIIFTISKKSKYTAEHIERMVQLSIMITEAINEDKEKYKDKNFNSEEIKEINFSALVHDIGKLATPEHIINKSTKLEKIYDRIKTIELRIEIIKKEFEILLLKNEINQQQFEEEIQKLERYTKIIQKSNKGSEYFHDKDVELINAIRKTKYMFDDKEYHILTEDEAYNLCVKKGTVTEKERQVINDHAQISIDVLNRLPFPDKYKNVPQIAGNHHEKINGTGYPKGLKGDEISFEARILAIADIFEALTSSDRPYKRANPLSTSMAILHNMAKNNDLDKGLVKFFYDSGLYMKYAKKFLPAKSIDKIHTNFNDLE